MTIKEAITLLGGAATELVCALAKPENNTTQLQRYIDAYDMAISALRAQQENPFGGWISVKDKLPEDDQEVILCTRETETYGKHREKKKIYKNIYIGYFDGYE